MRVDFNTSPNSTTTASPISMSPADMVQSTPEIRCTRDQAAVQLTPGIRKATML